MSKPTELELSYAEVILAIAQSDYWMFPRYVMYYPDIDENEKERFDSVTFQGWPAQRRHGVTFEKIDTPSDDGYYDPDTGEWMTPDEFVYAFDIREADLRMKIEDLKEQEQDD